MEEIHKETIKRILKENWWGTLIVLTTIIVGTYFNLTITHDEGKVVKQFTAMYFAGAFLGTMAAGTIWIVIEISKWVKNYWRSEVEKTKEIWEQKLDDL